MFGFSGDGGATGDGEGPFDDPDTFVAAHLPSPGPFLDGHAVLVGDDHVAFHRATRKVFEERTVYDMTFNYNLARLNLDTRHPDAGFRYAEDRDAPSVLRAEFTPTTPFCPQSQTLAVGAFRAWNDLSDRHDYDFVRVRVAPMHQQREVVNDRLEALERTEAEPETPALDAQESSR